MEQVLPFDNVPYDKSVDITGDISQMTAEQYFSWVRDQSVRMPNVFRASEETIASINISQPVKTIPELEEIPECPVDLLPSIPWERDMIHSFSELRSTIASKSIHYKERLVQVPQMKDRQAWLFFCLGPLDCDCANNTDQDTSSNLNVETDEIVEVKKRKRELAADLGITLDDQSFSGNTSDMIDVDCVDEDANEGEDAEIEVDDIVFPIWNGPTGIAPTLKLLLQLDQVITQKVLFYLVDFLEDNNAATQLLIGNLGQWIYSLLARVEKPLHRDTVALIRQLYRRCCILRNQLSANDEFFDSKLAILNTLISISGYYFGQGEYYRSFEPIVEILPVVNRESRNLLLEGSSDEDDDENDDTAEDDQDDAGFAEERPAKFRMLDNL